MEEILDRIINCGIELILSKSGDLFLCASGQHISYDLIEEINKINKKSLLDYISSIDGLSELITELNDIEIAIKAHPNVKHATLLLKEISGNLTQLVAHVSPETTEEKLDFSLFYFGANADSSDNKYDLYINAARLADKYGFEAIWTPERHFDPVGGIYPNPSILSAALATITSRVQLRAGSVVLPLHDPVRVAEEWSVVDNLSNGRVGIAIASGWHSRDFVLRPQNYEADFRRLAMFEGLNEIEQLWSGNTISRKNGKDETIEIEIFPKPIQKKLPLWVTAARSPETFIEAGRLGANVLAHLLEQSVEELSEKIALYRESLAKNGHDPKSGCVTLMLHTYLGADLDQTIAAAKAPFIKYMQAHIALILARHNKSELSPDNIDPADLEVMAELAFDRYVSSASLIGSPESVKKIVDQLKIIGVNEIACLIDWMDSCLALKGVESLNDLQSQTNEPFKNFDLVSSLKQHVELCLPNRIASLEFIILEDNDLRIENFGSLKKNNEVELSGLDEIEITI